MALFFHPDNTRLPPVDTTQGVHLHAPGRPGRGPWCRRWCCWHHPPSLWGGHLSWGRGWPLLPGGGGVLRGLGRGGFLWRGGGLHLMSEPTQKAFDKFSWSKFRWVGLWGPVGWPWGGGSIFSNSSSISPSHSPPTILAHPPPHPPLLCTPPIPLWPTPRPCSAWRPPRLLSRPSPTTNPSMPLGSPGPRRDGPRGEAGGC